MVMSGLVVLLKSDSCERDIALEAIRDVPQFMVGEPLGCWMTLALETPDAAESERLYDWLRNLPGVESVEVVFVHWDEIDLEVSRAVS